jgi:hypothetical protein
MFFVVSYRNVDFFAEKHVKMLENIMTNKDVNLEKIEKMFFLDTTSLRNENKTSFATLTNRQACSVESAAMANPNSVIFVIFLDKSSLGSSDPMKALRTLKNVVFLRINFLEFVKDTLVEKWVKTGAIYNSTFLPFNISNLLKAMLIWR